MYPPVPRSPFTDGWPQPTAAQQCQLPRSPFAEDWPAQQADPAQAPYDARPAGAAWKEQQPQQQQQQQRIWGASAPAGAPASAGAGSGGAPRRQRANRSGGPMPSAEAQRRQGNQLVRPASKGRVGIDLGSQRDKPPLLLRPLLALLPWLRVWGGFL